MKKSGWKDKTIQLIVIVATGFKLAWLIKRFATKSEDKVEEKS